MAFSFYLPTKIIFGPGSLASLGNEARRYGLKSMIVTSPDILKITGVAEAIIGDLNKYDITSIIFDNVTPNPRSTSIDAGACIARDKKVDLIIGLGGGSAMDTAKGVAVASGGNESIWHYITSHNEPAGPVPSLILVPTIAGSGSETNNAAVISNWETKQKMGLFSRYCYAKVAIVDPNLTLSVPVKATAQGGVDIFCHLAESYLTTNKPTPLTDGILETAMKMVVTCLPRILNDPKNIDARTQLSWASSIATSQFSTIGGGAGLLTLHGIEHALSGYYDIVHGDGMASLLLAWMNFTLPAVKNRFVSLGTRIFRERNLLKATEDWLEKVGMKIRLRELNVRLDQLGELASSAFSSSPFLKYNPRPLDVTSIEMILRDSY